MLIKVLWIDIEANRVGNTYTMCKECYENYEDQLAFNCPEVVLLILEEVVDDTPCEQCEND